VEEEKWWRNSLYIWAGEVRGRGAVTYLSRTGERANEKNEARQTQDIPKRGVGSCLGCSLANGGKR
jgi:hypothetical protein